MAPAPVKDVWVVMMNDEPVAVFSNVKAANSMNDKIEGQIKKFPLKSQDKADPPPPKPKNGTKRSAPADEDGEDDVDDDVNEEEEAPEPVKPQKKKARTTTKKPKEEIPDGVKGALGGVTIGLTGTACLTRDTFKEAIARYGGNYTEKCDEADYVVVGKRAGERKTQLLKDGGVAVISDTQLLAFFKGEEPDAP